MPQHVEVVVILLFLFVLLITWLVLRIQVNHLQPSDCITINCTILNNTHMIYVPMVNKTIYIYIDSYTDVIYICN
jgi:hypothetical protein